MFDLDKDEKLELHELQKVLSKYTQFQFSEENVRQMFQLIQQKHNCEYVCLIILYKI
jgi:Ca2+-binding EF-hand superfamily protein